MPKEREPVSEPLCAFYLELLEKGYTDLEIIVTQVQVAALTMRALGMQELGTQELFDAAIDMAYGKAGDKHLADADKYVEH